MFQYLEILPVSSCYCRSTEDFRYINVCRNLPEKSKIVKTIDGGAWSGYALRKDRLNGLREIGSKAYL